MQHTEFSNSQQTRADAWQAMLDQAGKHEQPKANPKSHESKWRAELALRDLRRADDVTATAFNRRR